MPIAACLVGNILHCFLCEFLSGTVPSLAQDTIVSQHHENSSQVFTFDIDHYIKPGQINRSLPNDTIYSLIKHRKPAANNFVLPSRRYKNSRTKSGFHNRQSDMSGLTNMKLCHISVPQIGCSVLHVFFFRQLSRLVDPTC